jgi:integrase
MVDRRAGLLRLPATILPIKDINKALSLALRRAGLLSNDTPKHEKITPHSFRRACITNWTNLGIPRDIVMVMSGHCPSNIHDNYLHLTDAMLRRALAAALGTKTPNGSGLL